MDEQPLGNAQARETIITEALSRIEEMQAGAAEARREVSQIADRLLGPALVGDGDKNPRGLSMSVGLANDLNGNLQILSDQLELCCIEIERLKAL